MPDGGTDEYRRIVLQARRETLRQMSQQAQRALANTYARQLGELIEELDRIPDTGAGRARAERLVREMEDAFRQYVARSGVVIDELTEEAVRSATNAHRRALSELNALEGTSLEAGFGRIPARAMEMMHTRRGLDVVGSFKTLSNFQAEQHAQVVQNAMADMLGKGETPGEASEKIARALATGDNELEAAFERFGLRGGLRRGEAGPINPVVQQEAKKLGFNARRIAISEQHNGFWEADRQANLESPVTRGVQWTLSVSHPEKDICDVYATQDLYGMGSGIYPAESVPPPPHPFDLCSKSPVFREPREWDQPKPSPSQPDTVSESTVRRQLDDPTDNEVQRVTETFNQQNQNAYSFWQNQ